MAAVATPTDRIVMQRAVGAVLSARAVTHSAAGCVYEGFMLRERGTALAGKGLGLFSPFDTATGADMLAPDSLWA